jgi:DNA-binding response OmpR family regulator
VRILVVEDEPSAARLLARGLRGEAYAVDVAADRARKLIHTRRGEGYLPTAGEGVGHD